MTESLLPCLSKLKSPFESSDIAYDPWLVFYTAIAGGYAPFSILPGLPALCRSPSDAVRKEVCVGTMLLPLRELSVTMESVCPSLWNLLRADTNMASFFGEPTNDKYSLSSLGLGFIFEFL